MQGEPEACPIQQDMPDFLPDRGGGDGHVPGICGLAAGMTHIRHVGLRPLPPGKRGRGRAAQGRPVWACGYLQVPIRRVSCRSFRRMGTVRRRRNGLRPGVALRAGVHCAPTAHESAGTLETGTVRASFGPDASPEQTRGFLQTAAAPGAERRGRRLPECNRSKILALSVREC